MRDRQTCIDCGKLSPETDTNYTLISSQFGWRLTRTRMPSGEFVVEWRCPDCWRNYKKTKSGQDSTSAAWPGAPSTTTKVSRSVPPAPASRPPPSVAPRGEAARPPAGGRTAPAVPRPAPGSSGRSSPPGRKRSDPPIKPR